MTTCTDSSLTAPAPKPDQLQPADSSVPLKDGSCTPLAVVDTYAVSVALVTSAHGAGRLVYRRGADRPGTTTRTTTSAAATIALTRPAMRTIRRRPGPRGGGKADGAG